MSIPRSMMASLAVCAIEVPSVGTISEAISSAASAPYQYFCRSSQQSEISRLCKAGPAPATALGRRRLAGQHLPPPPAFGTERHRKLRGQVGPPAAAFAGLQPHRDALVLPQTQAQTPEVAGSRAAAPGDTTRHSSCAPSTPSPSHPVRKH